MVPGKILALLSVVVILGGLVIIYSEDAIEKHEVWDCSFEEDETCIRTNITEYENCESEGQYDEDHCERTSEGIEDVTLFTDDGNYITSELTAEDYDVDVFDIGHNLAWDSEILEDGSVIYSEMEGNVVMHDGEQETKRANLDGVERLGNSGLLGIAADPDFEENHYIYLLYYSDDREVSEDAEEEVNDPIYNRVSRFEFRDQELTDEKVLIDNIEANRGHSGGRLAISPDNYLHITTGDSEYAKTSNEDLHERVQDPDFLGGKVLKIDLDGNPAEDNAFEDSYVYSYGLRNPQGIDFHPETGQAFVSMHGPWRHDEVNVIESGANYGWPGEKCGYEYQDIEVENTTDPLQCFEEWTLAPSGTTFVDDPDHEWYNSYFVTGLRGSIVYRILTDGQGDRIDSEVFYIKDELEYEAVNHRLRNIEFHNESLYLFGDGHGAAKITPN